MKEGGYSKGGYKTTIIAFVINYLFFIYQCHYILVIIMDMIFQFVYVVLSLAITSLSLWLNVRFYFLQI
nr:Uncharacterised protein [Klebsiella pneumoniae]